MGSMPLLLELVRQVGHGLGADLEERPRRVDRHVHADVAVRGGPQVAVEDLVHGAAEPLLGDQLVGQGIARRRRWGVLAQHGRRESDQDRGREPTPKRHAKPPCRGPERPGTPENYTVSAPRRAKREGGGRLDFRNPFA